VVEGARLVRRTPLKEKVCKLQKGFKGSNMNYYTYILRSQKDEKYYYGSTNNIENRLKKHNKGDVKSTKSRRPLEVIYSECFDSRAEAWRREYFFKTIEGYKWLKSNNII
jgi:putative endonuclease